MGYCRHLVGLRKILQKVSNMAGGRSPMVMKLMVRPYKKSWNNLRIIFWVEKHLRFGRTTGLNMQISGQVSMMEQNTFYQGPGKSRIRKTPYSSRTWPISKSSKTNLPARKVQTSRFGEAVISFICYWRMILLTNSGSKFIHWYLVKEKSYLAMARTRPHIN